MKTYMQKKQEQNLEWFLVDATDKVLGRVATKIADLLRGKDRPDFTPHLDGGRGVIVINVDKIKVTGNKAADKRYYWHTGYPGGVKFKTYEELMESHPEKPLYSAVKGMLPKNKLRDQMMTRLRIFTGEAHPHAAQQPKTIEI
jgi:large subunit ribosomal protein L13